MRQYMGYVSWNLGYTLEEKWGKTNNFNKINIHYNINLNIYHKEIDTVCNRQ